MTAGNPSVFHDIRLDRFDDGRVVCLTLCRPEARNAISRRLAVELQQACGRVVADSAVRALIVAGEGERAFSAGADLRERRRLSPSDRAAHTAAIEAAAEALASLPMPTVAAVRGFALAGGAELAVACDLRVAGTDAIFGFPEVRIGIFPGAGGVLRLSPLVGAGAARDLLFTGRRIDAVEAHRIGLVDRLVEPPLVVEAAVELARSIALNGPLAVRAVKKALRAAEGRLPAVARAEVNALRAALDDTADYDEGLAAFAEKREPRFRGE